MQDVEIKGGSAKISPAKHFCTGTICTELSPRDLNPALFVSYRPISVNMNSQVVSSAWPNHIGIFAVHLVYRWPIAPRSSICNDGGVLQFRMTGPERGIVRPHIKTLLRHEEVDSILPLFAKGKL